MYVKNIQHFCIQMYISYDKQLHLSEGPNQIKIMDLFMYELQHFHVVTHLCAPGYI